jgi:hypothetical protein
VRFKGDASATTGESGTAVAWLEEQQMKRKKKTKRKLKVRE